MAVLGQCLPDCAKPGEHLHAPSVDGVVVLGDGGWAELPLQGAVRPSRIHPVIVLLLAGLALALWLVLPILQFRHARPGAPLAYTLDDAYIHMAMAKNLVQHGVFGLTPAGFTSSSSSLLWPLLVALGFLLTGVNVLVPALLNTAAALASLVFAWRLVRRSAGDHPLVLLLALLGVAWAAPLAPLVLSGMEAPLQIALTLAFLDAALPILAVAPGGAPSRSQIAALLGWGVALGSVRYESLVLVASVCLALAWQRRLRLALILGAASVLPSVVFGLISMAAGWHFLPNSVLIKTLLSSQPWEHPLVTVGRRLKNLVTETSLSHLKLLLYAGTAALLLELRWPSPRLHGRRLLTLLLPLLLAQALLGQVGYFYRYEAHVVAFGIVTLAAVLGDWLLHWPWRAPRTARLPDGLRLAVVVMALASSGTLLARGQSAADEVTDGMTNVHDQQVQMARFARTYYARVCVMAHDVGALGLQGGDCVIDLFGLAHRDTGEAAMRRQPLRPLIERLVVSHRVPIAMIYANWFRDRLPAQWIAVGAWTLDRRVTAGAPTVTFYATRPDQVETLRQQLREFGPSLPVSEAWEVW